MAASLVTSLRTVPGILRAPPVSAAAAREAATRLQFDLQRRQAYQWVLDGEWKKSAQAFDALSRDARFKVGDWLALATANLRMGRHDDAREAAVQAMALEPRNPKAAHIATLALMTQNRWAEALALFERHRDGPAREHYPFVVNHGTTLAALQRQEEAVPVLLEAMTLNLTDPAVHMKLGLALRDMKMFEESAECFVTALALDPKRLAARLMALHMRQYACQWQGFEAAREGIVEALADDSGEGGSLSEGGVFTLVAIDHPPALFRRATAQVAMRHPQVHTPLPTRPIVRQPGRPIRIGYVSNDWHNHATALLFVESLEQRDRNRFDVTLYSHSKDDGSAMQHRVRSACERLVDISAMSDGEAARRIRADGIDLLVDLKGHTAGNRLGIFAWRPAPLQVTFLGFPGTSGADYIDYIVGDREVTPLEHAPHYSERIAQMPGSYQPNDSRRPRPAPCTRDEAGLPADAIVLGAFNQAFKLTPQTWDVWMDILKAVPGSVLWMLEDNAQATRNLRREAQARGVAPERLLFAPRLPYQQNLARLPLADLMLDNWPCNAHTTAGDMLWMGVPMLTLQGEAFAARVAGSLLKAMDLPELVCRTPEAYRQRAIELLSDPSRLAELRVRIDRGRRNGTLFDGARHARDLEALYDRMIDRAVAGLPPAALPAVA